MLKRKFEVLDSSGIIEVESIETIGKKKIPSFGTICKVVIKEVSPKVSKTYLKGNLLHGLIVLDTKKHKDKDGSSFWYDKRGIIIVKKNNKGNWTPIGNRILSPIGEYLEKSKNIKLILNDPELI
uniref:Ribosomal protein L14 n=1 Tax=Ministeria vibrans TaxID=134558 RepID=M1JZX8_MINVI|nr:ribosomal protein L14 [Ministeria vibrans]AGE93712.1 ribosomal protein L14 [Ministeria vibrans]